MRLTRVTISTRLTCDTTSTRLTRVQVAVLQGANVEKLKQLVDTHKAPMTIQGEDF